MEQSPLELYETAYKLHYVQNRISDALLHYQKIIEVFPDSNECGYASIQIQKIKAENLANELKKAGKILHPAAMVALILGAMSLILTATFGIILNRKVNLESKKSTLTLRALSRMENGDAEDALKILTELKILSSTNILPFELSADILAKQNKFTEAREEFSLFYKLNPRYQPTESEKKVIQKLNEKKSGSKKSTPTKKSNEISLNSEKKDQAPVQVRKTVIEKDPLIINTDSVSYF
jgi:tetratricopeptide (TPR) repeat protein